VAGQDDVANQQVTPFGVPINWPAFQRFREFGNQNHFGHINCLIWPEVNGFWAHAVARHKRYDSSSSSC
jgi:hypothetical protein